MPKAIITDTGITKLTAAAGSESQVAISHVALGDGNGVTYDPVEAQVALVNERVRLPIESRQHIDNNIWRVKVEFPPETDAIDVREVGYFDAEGDLIAIWAGLDVEPRATGVISYIINQALNFSRVANGLIIVDAPDDQYFDFAVQTLLAQAITANEQHRQRLAISALEQGA